MQDYTLKIPIQKNDYINMDFVPLYHNSTLDPRSCQERGRNIYDFSGVSIKHWIQI